MLKTGVLISALLLCLSGAAVAQTPAPPAELSTNPDPYEGFNRRIFAIFQSADAAVLRPAAIFYSHATPQPVQVGLRNAFRNLHEPVVFVNDVFQLKPSQAASTLGRFALNTTVGVAGLLDPAADAGLPHHDNGFGTTLGRYGAPSGPYLFLIGPSSVRDLIGTGVDTLSDPLTWINFNARLGFGIGRGVVGTLDERAQADGQLKAVKAMSTDEYASLRSLYLQNRAAEISGGQVNVNDLPSFSDTPAPPATPPKP